MSIDQSSPTFSTAVQRILHRSAAFVACAILASGCASSENTGPQSDLVYEDEEGEFSLTLKGHFAPATHKNQAIDAYFLDSETGTVVAIIIDRPAKPAAIIDQAVVANAQAGHGEGGVDILHTAKAIKLGNLPALQTKYNIRRNNEPALLTYNLHTSTTNRNLQVIVGGPRGNEVTKLVASIRASGFRFLKPVEAFPPPPIYRLDDKALPVTFRGLPPGWERLTPKVLNADAQLEMSMKAQDVWMMLQVETFDDETVALAATNSDFLTSFTDLVHESVAEHLDAVPPGNTKPYSSAGTPRDLRWSVSGVLKGKAIALTYRMRLVTEKRRALKFFCWGPAPNDVTSICNALYASVTIKTLH